MPELDEDEEYDDWEQNEIRPDRDPADYLHQKAVCCWDRARFVAEIPRSRKVGLTEHEAPPARFVLCQHHAEILIVSDPRATVYPLRRTASE